MKIATTGTSFITEWFLTAVNNNEGIEAAAVYSRNEETGQALANKFNIEKVYTNYDELLKDETIDMVYVASPNSLHYEMSLKALQANKHVICEKPFTSNEIECEKLIEEAEKRRLFLFEAITTVHLPNYKKMKEYLPKLGNIKMVQCNFSQYSRKYDQFKNGGSPNVFTTKYSGGALMDINIYNLHFIMGCFGMPSSMHYFPNLQRDIDTSGSLILDYGTFKAIAVGAKDSRSQNIAQIQGDEGYIVVNDSTSRCGQIEVHLKDETIQIKEQDQEVVLTYEVKDFIDIINRQDYDTCYQKLAYSLNVMKVLHKARKNAGIYFDADKATE